MAVNAKGSLINSIGSIMNSIQIINDKLNSQTSRLDFSEMNNVLQDESGYRLELYEVLFSQMKLKWGKYNNLDEKVLSFHPDKTTVVSHFRITDSSTIVNKNQKGISEGQFVVYHEKPEPYNLYLAPTKEKWCSFFEVGMSETIFNHLFTEESDFLLRFSNYMPLQIPSFDFTASILPKMYAIINDMYRTSFQGHLKGLFLEVKAIELFLLQIEQLDKRACATHAKLKKHDIECLHEIKEYLELNFDQPTSIAALSRKVGINSMKLKAGFKQLFNTTVFGYLHSIRMQEAKRLLLEENMYVNEVADRVGYKYPHHFTAAFKKQFNITPSQLRK